MERRLRDFEAVNVGPSEYLAKDLLWHGARGETQLLELSVIADGIDTGDAVQHLDPAIDPDPHGVGPIARLDLSETAVEDLATPEDHEDEITHLLGDGHVVSAQDDRGAVAAEVEHGLAEDLGIEGIEATEGLVEDHEFGTRHDGGDELNALAG